MNRVLKHTFLLLLSLVVVSKAMAQNERYSFSENNGIKVRTEWGIGVEASHTRLSHTSADVVVKPNFGLGGHVHIGVVFGRNFAVETEIHYQRGSVDVASPKFGVSDKIETRTNDIPVMLSLRLLNNRIQFDAGAMFTVMSRAEYLDQDNTMFFGPMYSTWNLTFGAAVRLTRHFLLEAHYVYPLAETTNQYMASEFTMRASRINGGVTLMF